jgi:hypothetical protein
MMAGGIHPDLIAALALSREVVTAADQGDMQTLAQLDGQRLQLLKSFRSESRQVAPTDRAVLYEISELNERALGLMEHHRRIKGRALDMAAVGRRAVDAYATNRQQR